METREEWFETKVGSGQLELRGGDLEVALFVAGRPLIYDAADCGGSVGRFTALLPQPPSISQVRSVEINAQNGFENEAPLSEQIAPLLALLPAGKYHLSLTGTNKDWMVGWHWDDGNAGQVGSYYLTDEDEDENYKRPKCLISTQPDEALQDSRINFYLSEIERGTRPALILVGATGHDAWFVLDGHHKLIAAYCCGVRLRALLIKFQNLAPIAARQAQEILREVDPKTIYQNYLKVKTRRG